MANDILRTYGVGPYAQDEIDADLMNDEICGNVDQPNQRVLVIDLPPSPFFRRSDFQPVISQVVYFEILDRVRMLGHGKEWKDLPSRLCRTFIASLGDPRLTDGSYRRGIQEQRWRVLAEDSR
jgi:hypothetical protein